MWEEGGGKRKYILLYKCTGGFCTGVAQPSPAQWMMTPSDFWLCISRKEGRSLLLSLSIMHLCCRVCRKRRTKLVPRRLTTLYTVQQWVFFLSFFLSFSSKREMEWIYKINRSTWAVLDSLASWTAIYSLSFFFLFSIRPLFVCVLWVFFSFHLSETVPLGSSCSTARPNCPQWTTHRKDQMMWCSTSSSFSSDSPDGRDAE